MSSYLSKEQTIRQNKAICIHHRTTVTKGNFCKPFTEKEHRKVKTKSKGAGSKGRKHAHTKLWTYHNSGVSFKTNTKKVR
jgi:hypothetical protein